MMVARWLHRLLGECKPPVYRLREMKRVPNKFGGIGGEFVIHADDGTRSFFLIGDGSHWSSFPDGTPQGSGFILNVVFRLVGEAENRLLLEEKVGFDAWTFAEIRSMAAFHRSKTPGFWIEA